MPGLGEIVRRLRALVQRTRVERDLDEEMSLHVDLRQEQLREQGLPAQAARDAAARRFGNLLRLREDSVDAWGWRWTEQLLQDVRFGGRTLLKSPGFAATVVLTLALATGATTAIFSIVNSVLLRPLPFADPDRLVQVHGRNWREDRGGVPDLVTGPVGTLELEAYRKQSTTFDAFVGYGLTTRHLKTSPARAGEGATGLERLTAVQADGALFSMLGVDAIAGRTFRVDDPPDVAVISASLWERRFDRDPSLPGKTITLNERPFTVLGVMPEAFQFPYGAASMMAGALTESRTDVWVPLERQGRGSVVGRLRPGVSIEAAAAELRVIAGRVEQHYRAQPGGANARAGVRLTSLTEVVIGQVRRSLWMLFAAAGLVLAAACANVANLLLARMTVRTREVVTRAALGASRLRLIRQVLAESLLLSLAGGVLGAFVARWGTNLLVVLGSAKIPRAHEVALDWRTFGFLFMACLVTAVLFGLAPALAAARVDLQTITKESGGHATIGRRYGRMRDSLVVLEVALAFVLGLGAALVMREVIRLQNVRAGMVTENVLALHLTPAAPARDYYAIEERLAHLPGIRAAGFIQLVPLQNWGWEAGFSIRGRPAMEHDGRQAAGLRYVTPGYFRTLGIPVISGRAFTDADTAEAPHVILINEALAHRYFPGEDPVGREMDRGMIAGVVGDVRQVGLDRPSEPELYYPAAQNVTMASDIGMSLMVRTSGPPERLIDVVRSAVRAVNPNLAIFNIRTMDQVRADSLWELNLYRWLIGLSATLVLVLAAIGLYGVISYSVRSRMREFAVRLALGSDPARLASLVLARGVRLAAAGLAVGILAALAVTPSLQNLSVHLRGDPAMYAAMSVLIAVIALLACAVPALRGARVNPATALRHD